jgi:hypothetical protein
LDAAAFLHARPNANTVSTATDSQSALSSGEHA